MAAEDDGHLTIPAGREKGLVSLCVVDVYGRRRWWLYSPSFSDYTLTFFLSLLPFRS
jgi:hypothetical protein